MKRKKPRLCGATGKRVYPTITDAIRAAIGSSVTFGKPLRYYRCAVCKGYHLTSRVG
jgi:hypothetical protein